MKRWKVDVPPVCPVPPPPAPRMLNIIGLAKRWGFDHLSAVINVVESDDFPRSTTYVGWWDMEGGYDLSPVELCEWTEQSIIAWEQSFVIADREKKEAAIIRREIVSRSKKEQA